MSMHHCSQHNRCTAMFDIVVHTNGPSDAIKIYLPLQELAPTHNPFGRMHTTDP